MSERDERALGGRRVALYGFLGSGNLGNDASFETLRAALERDPRTDLSVVTIAPEAVTERYGLRARQLRSRLGRCFDAAHTFALVHTVEVVAVPGMGVLEETLGVRFWGLPLWLLLVAVAARTSRRRFALVAVGAEPVRNPITRWFFRATVRLAHHVSFRDEWSAQAMGRSARTGARVTPDLAFAHPTLAERPAPAPVVGTVLVGVLDWHGWSDDRAAGGTAHTTYVQCTARLVRGLLDNGDRVVLTGGDAVDAACAEQVRDAVATLDPPLAPGLVERISLHPVSTYADLIDLVDGAEAVVGTRFHTLVASLSRGRPTVSVAYAEKCSRLLTWFGLERASVPIDDWDPDHLLARLAALRADADLPARLSARAEQAADEVGDLLEELVGGRVPADLA